MRQVGNGGKDWGGEGREKGEWGREGKEGKLGEERLCCCGDRRPCQLLKKLPEYFLLAARRSRGRNSEFEKSVINTKTSL